MVEVLHPDVTRTADPQVFAPGAAQRMHGRKAVVEETRAMRAAARRARLALIDGRLGVAVGADHDPHAALAFHIAGGKARSLTCGQRGEATR